MFPDPIPTAAHPPPGRQPAPASGHADPPEISDPAWFRPPSRRERLIAAALFIGFAVFFVLLFLVQGGWWFRWVVLSLAALSAWCGVRHAFLSSREQASENEVPRR